MTGKIKPRKETPLPVTDLAGHMSDDAETVIIKVGGRLFRVRQDILEAKPEDYSPWGCWDGLAERYCLICAFSLGHPENVSLWTPPMEIRCLVHRQPNGGRSTTPHCPYCSQEMVCVLPLEVTLHQLRYLWICEDRHCHVITESREGIK